MYEIDLLKLSEFFKNEIIVEQRKKIKELEKELSYRDCFIERLNRHLEDYCKRCEELEKENKELKVCLFQVQNASISLTKQLDQLKKNLKEIKDICLEAPAIDTEFSLRVLEKISEVEDETNTDNTI